MITALDSSVLLDVLLNDPAHVERSERAVREAMRSGALIIGESVAAEIAPALPDGMMDEFLSDWGVRFVPSSIESSRLAGSMFAHYLKRRRSEARVIPDFLIGAHARIHADQLLARDRGYYRDYFKGLKVITP